MASKVDVLILGGGFAGLSCATALAEKGAKVVLLEKKPHLGGRAYSFKDPATGEPVDNGQHLFMGCYRQTLRFLERIGTTERLRFLDEVRVDFADTQGGRDALRCPTAFGAPLHLALGVLGLRGLSLADKWGLRRLDQSLRQMRSAGVPEALDRLTVRQWLDSLGQSRRIQERLFDPIALGALNDDPGVAAATGFAQAMAQMFFSDVPSSRLGVAAVGLSELYAAQSPKFIEARGGQVLSSKKLASLKESGGRVTGAVTESGEVFEADMVVSTLAPWDLARLELPQALRGPWEALKPAPIVSLCLWLDRPILEEPLIGLLGTEIQWVFNKSRLLEQKGAGQCLNLVISGAHRQLAFDPKALLAIAERDLAKCLPAFKKAKITAWKVVKEPFATLSPVPGSDSLRPRAQSALPGFLFAGDWTKTGLPATIESAVTSGHIAAELALKGETHAEVG